ncbi:fungal-specific transcription factor domain-containing protein [Tricladium varicosporioides]|nr:fungal-specific transcription factor domain-containing protein [Hymenoscyphus varicosporioides]
MPVKQLSWQPGFSLSRKPVRRSAPRRNRQQQFEFVVEYPIKDQQAKKSPSITTFTRSRSLANSLREHSVISDKLRAYSQGEAVEENGCSADTPPWASTDELLIGGEEIPNLEMIYGTTEPYLNSYNIRNQFSPLCSPESTIERHLQLDESSISLGTSHDRLSQIPTTGPNPAAASALINIICSPSTSVPPTIEYSNLSQRFRPILNRYNTEFCTIPLTFDLRINPFRYRTNLDPEPIFLVHAVMALAGHHVESTLTLNHRHAALGLLRQSLNTNNIAENIYSMLDTIIILFSLDETQSALGNWSTHLMGAYSLLEACGGIKVLGISTRVEAQIGLLTWWDAIISLLSREECVFPYAYFEAVMSNQNSREWDFFGLCGCPISLVKIAMQVARLSAERQKLSSTRDIIFDTTIISEIVQSLESWHHVPAAMAFQDEECMQQDQDIMHCSEAWRNGLLLYVFRVFQWELGSRIPMHILHRARVLVDHVVSCRDVAMISRQALLPLFFAGCELGDQSTRTEIVRYCSVWNEKTRYHVFSSTIPLLEEVWAEQETRGFENVWWGQIVDKQHSYKSHCPLQMRLCFG